MAKQKVFSAYDSKIQVWMQPMFFQHSGQAERTWKEICNNPESIVSKNPQDFILYQIGEFDDENGRLDSIAPAVQLMSAAQAMMDTSPAADYPRKVNHS